MNLIVKILDIEDNRVKWITKYPDASHFWWSEGNGCCDCNRRIYFERETNDYDYESDYECTSNRYFIIDIFEIHSSNYNEFKLKNDYEFDYDVFHLYNQSYDNYREAIDIISNLKNVQDRHEKINNLLND